MVDDKKVTQLEKARKLLLDHMVPGVPMALRELHSIAEANGFTDDNSWKTVQRASYKLQIKRSKPPSPYFWTLPVSDGSPTEAERMSLAAEQTLTSVITRKVNELVRGHNELESRVELLEHRLELIEVSLVGDVPLDSLEYREDGDYASAHVGIGR